MLRSLVLAVHNNPGWKVGYAHSGFGFVNVLTTSTTRSESFNLDLIGVD
jgi:hypothetical protein